MRRENLAKWRSLVSEAQRQEGRNLAQEFPLQ